MCYGVSRVEVLSLTASVVDVGVQMRVKLVAKTRSKKQAKDFSRQNDQEHLHPFRMCKFESRLHVMPHSCYRIDK